MRCRYTEIGYFSAKSSEINDYRSNIYLIKKNMYKFIKKKLIYWKIKMFVLLW